MTLDEKNNGNNIKKSVDEVDEASEKIKEPVAANERVNETKVLDESLDLSSKKLSDDKVKENNEKESKLKTKPNDDSESETKESKKTEHKSKL